MKKVLTYTGYILLILLVGYMLYRFNYILIWIIIAAMLSFIGQPVVHLLDRIRIRKLRMPRPLSALLALFVIVIVLAGLFAVFVPLIIKQAQNISSIDINLLNQNLQGPLLWLDKTLNSVGAIPEGITVEEFLLEKIKTVVNISSVGNAIGNLISAAGNIFIGLFSILFISFFFLKDDTLFQEGLLLFIPPKHHEATLKVVSESKSLLIRYYLGVLLEVLAVTTLITLGLKIFGIRNALLIGFFAGIMNIIPYIGPIIGGLIGISLGVISMLTTGAYGDLLPAVLKIAGTLIAVNMIDNNILVPVIYSRSVKSHPLEIFLVIIIGGGLAGLVGMLFAVPVYTLLRVIAKEFFNNFRVVRKLTDQIDQQ
ncbi:MAG TPA: AI-2E family transporter [Bacteroidales bacterium]|nr:AI-2E family transporter [Bacteroidales bacterium]HPJ59920.1 AI-2E family transporter [Bacteroidales bacterium]HPR12308.1 AI-2E family transporter [Bacteroidales bacterium]HRW83840.1 AI-2E family transporter [Bacteroidales bacterium]